MAETIVNLVLEKITAAAVKEILHLWGVGDQVEKMQRELNWIQAFLKDADRKQIEDETQKQWVKEVRDVAYWIEDAIDTFLCEVPQKNPGKREFVKRMLGKTTKLPVIHRLGDEMNQILDSLQEICDKKVRYGINNLGEGSGKGKKLPIRPRVLPDIEDSGVVGFDADKDNIVKELLDKDTSRRCVVSIVGPGGLGKTTLANKVYNSIEVRKAFDIRIWVAISQEFELINVLKKIRGKIQMINESEQGKDEEYFLTDIYRSLKGNKYLLVIDDVWTKEVWMDVEKALPDEGNGSRILMTTRIFEVAKEADPAQEPYNLKFLTEKSSLELFLKKALINQEIQNNCPDDLLDLAQQFAKKCGGLPLALVVLGGLLAKKKPTYSIWSKVMQTLSWHSNEQKLCMEVIGISYDDLPFALKSCFMYFAAFPEDYNINANLILRLWIAEGFIPHEENRTLEDTAESFLEDLVQRSMVQVSDRSSDNDSITRCRVHDLLRDVAIQKAKEDNFLMVCSNQEQEQNCGGARRVAVHNSDCNVLMKHASPNLRTLLFFNSKFPDCSGHRHLKVLGDMTEIFSFKFDPADMKGLGELSHLRFLRLTGEKVVWNQRHVEKLISNLKFLQTLYLQFFIPGCDKDSLDDLWRIKTLRHVDLVDFTLGPPLKADLRDLQTLLCVKTRESWETVGLPNLPNLRQLRIEITEGFPWSLFVVFLHTLKRLVALHISGRDIPIEIIDMRGFPFYQHLKILKYWGRLSYNGLDVTMFPAHLTNLELSDSELQQDHIAVLEKLQVLKHLSLWNAYQNQTMRFSNEGFPHLQEFEIMESEELEEWEIEEGAMPTLNYLHVYHCPKLRVPHGLQHLSTLSDLTWYLNPGEELALMKAEEIRNVCKHVHSVNIKGLEED